MAAYKTDAIRNVIFLGHSGAGKTSLAEAILHKTGQTNRLGKVSDKTSFLDSDELEKEHGHSIYSAVGHTSYKGKEINLIDTPGYPDFLGASLSALPGAETAIVVISASAGVQMNTRKLFQAARDRGMACIVVVNKIDGGSENLEGVVKSIQESFGRECVCANLASQDGKSVLDCTNSESGEGAFADVGEAHTNLIETIIEADDLLMESYLGGEALSKEQLDKAFTQSLVSGAVVPIVFTSAIHEVGIEALLDLVADDCPSPIDGVQAKVALGEGEDATTNALNTESNGQLIGYVLRISNDPKSNIKYSTVRILSGTMKGDQTLQATGGKKGMRCGHIYKLQGDRLDAIDEGVAGDIVTLSKVEEPAIRDTIFIGDEPGRVVTPVLPVPMYSLALQPKRQGDETKISGVLTEISESDPTFVVTRNTQTKELVASGLGDLHVRMILSRMQHRRGLEVETRPPQIPYRETITASVKFVEYTHKKQSGGAGQFARVFVDMEPNERGAGYEFVDKIFGGAIDQPLRPSVDKGCRAAVAEGVLAGFPVVDVKVTLVDGKTHPVDSKDIAFQIAGREVFRKAFHSCKPTLLEPIVHIEVTVPSENVGDITGDLAGRRGRVQGQDMLPGNMTVIKAQVPLAELQQYNSQLKSVTSGQGSYSMELSHYEPMPSNVAQQVIAKLKAKKEGS